MSKIVVVILISLNLVIAGYRIWRFDTVMGDFSDLIWAFINGLSALGLIACWIGGGFK